MWEVVNLDCGHWIQQEKPEETSPNDLEMAGTAGSSSGSGSSEALRVVQAVRESPFEASRPAAVPRSAHLIVRPRQAPEWTAIAMISIIRS